MKRSVSFLGLRLAISPPARASASAFAAIDDAAPAATWKHEAKLALCVLATGGWERAANTLGRNRVIEIVFAIMAKLRRTGWDDQYWAIYRVSIMVKSTKGGGMKNQLNRKHCYLC